MQSMRFNKTEIRLKPDTHTFKVHCDNNCNSNGLRFKNLIFFSFESILVNHQLIKSNAGKGWSGALILRYAIYMDGNITHAFLNRKKHK